MPSGDDAQRLISRGVDCGQRVHAGVSLAWRVLKHDHIPVETQFQMIRDSGVFDYLDRLPLPDVLDEYIRGSENTAGSRRLEVSQHYDLYNAVDGHVVTDNEVTDCYLRTWELADKIGVHPTFELHVNMWSEDFRGFGRSRRRCASTAFHSISRSITAIVSSRSKSRRTGYFPHP